MNAPAIADDLASYIAEVERLLDDLPDEDRRELIDDVHEHLTEVAAEDEGSLVERLGPPDTYVAELRAAAGFPPYVRTEDLPTAERLKRRVSASSLGTIASLPAVRAVRTFLPELRPAWWVVRGYLFAVVVDALFFRANVDGGLPWPSFTPGDAVFGTLFVIACVVVSIIAGRAATRDVRRRTLAVVVNVAIVLAFAAALPRYELGSASVNMVAAAPQPFGMLQHGDGSPITAICAYDSDGERVKDVELFDQDGRPLIEGLRGKLSVIVEQDGGPGVVRVVPPGRGRKLGAGAGFECPKKLKDLQSKESQIERGLIRKKLLEDGPLGKVRPFVGDGDVRPFISEEP